jgi:tRNA threonylcarbamoyl adenosine modification protein (Sua5/YciO/YrdC/YwlC family)
MNPARILPTGQAESLQLALELLQDGQVVAFPTDTVYGLAADLHNPQAIQRLYAIKGREAAKAIGVLVGSPQVLDQITAGMNSLAQHLAQRFWPGPLTLVVPSHPSLPAILSPLPTVGVRMPDHVDALALLNLSGPLAVTSANLSGAASAVIAQDVYDQIGAQIPLILDGGKAPGGLSSTVVDCTQATFKILRVGPISQQELEAALR